MVALEPIRYTDIGGKWGSVRLYVGGEDWTMFRGVPAQIGELQFQDPYVWGPGSFNLPQITQDEQWGVGELAPLYPGSKVEVWHVDTDGVPVRLMWKGLIQTLDSEATGVQVECAGWISGHLESRDWHGPTNDPKKTLGRHIFDALRYCKIRSVPHLGIDTGAEIKNNFEPSTYLELVDNLLGLSERINGETLTIGADDSGQAIVKWRDRATVSAKVYLGPGVSISAGRELSEEPTAIFGRTKSKNGELQRNLRHPYRMNGDPDNYPGSPLSEGDEGPYVTILKQRLVGLGFLSREEANREVNGVYVPGGFNNFNDATTDAVKALQRRAGIPRTGVVNERTWNAMYDLKKRGKYQRKSFVAPLVEIDETRKWDYTGTGVIEAPNPAYDRNRMEVDRSVEAPVDKRRLTKWADRYMDWVHEDPPHVGQLTLETDLFPPDHEPGTEPEWVLSRMDIGTLIGKRIRVEGYQGGKVFHLAGASLSAFDLRAVCDVDTGGRDLREVIAVVERRKESRQSHSRQHVKRGRGIGNGSHKQADEHFGWLPDRRKIGGDQWSVIRVDAANAGRVARMRIKTENAPAEFCVAVFGQPVTAKQCRRWFGNPFADEGWAESQTALRLADDENMLQCAVGTAAQPGGYAPKKKTGRDDEPTGAPLTGLMIAGRGFPYSTYGDGGRNTRSGELFIAIYADRNTVLPPQRILEPGRSHD